MGSCLSVDGSGSLSPYPPTSPRMKLKEMRKRNSTEKDDLLQKIPGRMYLNGATKIASIYTQQGKKGINQDAMIVWENFGSRTDTIFCGVFDGHGPFGHVVSRKVRDSLPLKLSAHWGVHVRNGNSPNDNVNGVGSLPSDQTPSVPVDEQLKPPLGQDKKEKLPEIFTTLKESFRKACRVMDKELKLHPNIDCFCSGTTAVTLVKQGQDLVIGNLGDSRAVLGTRDEDNTLLAMQLTVDLKPNVPREAERIKRCKGRVFALRDEPEVARVWLPNHDTPGLAMARAFGDFCLKDFGLISVPEVTYRRLTERDEFVVLATDGIWDVLSNKDVVEIVAAAPSRKLAARFLVDTAVRSWRMKYPTSKVDDCAVVCLFFEDNGKSEADFKTDDSVVESLAAASTIFSPESDQHSNPDLATGSPTTKKAKPMRSLSRQVSPEEEETQTASGDWSAIEGVTRVNTLLALPRLDVKQDTK